MWKIVLNGYNPCFLTPSSIKGSKFVVTMFETFNDPEDMIEQRALSPFGMYQDFVFHRKPSIQPF